MPKKLKIHQSLSSQVEENKPGKLAPYQRLKNSKRTSKCQVFSSTAPEKPKSWTELSRKGGGTFLTSTLLQSIEKF